MTPPYSELVEAIFPKIWTADYVDFSSEIRATKNKLISVHSFAAGGNQAGDKEAKSSSIEHTEIVQKGQPQEPQGKVCVCVCARARTYKTFQLSTGKADHKVYAGAVPIVA